MLPLKFFAAGTDRNRIVTDGVRFDYCIWLPLMSLVLCIDSQVMASAVYS